MPPHDAAARAAAQVPEGASLLQLLACNAAEHGRSVAMRERNRGIWEEFTWQQYLEQVLAAAAGLEGLGLGAQDKLLVVGDNPLSELAAGRALGATTVQTVRPGVEPWPLADHRVEGLQGLLALLSADAPVAAADTPAAGADQRI